MSSNDKDTARPHFYVEAIKNNAKSEAEGRPIFEDREMVKITIPGDRLSNWVGYVTDVHRERWPEHYAAFKRGEARASVGTPLEHWPCDSLTVARVAELKALNILSVEELASVPDNTLPRIGMGARALRDQAKAYIANAKGGAETAAMAARIAQLEEMILAMRGNASPAPAPEPEPEEKAIEDLSNEELKAYIKRETGSPVLGNPSRETLIERATAIATTAEEAA